MPLVDLKTNLKSLKYGNDRLGNGSSREPFITEPIPEGDTPGASTDFLLRQGAIRNSGKDASRLTQLLFSTTRGLLFTTGNQLLSRTSVKTEATLGPAYAGGAINQGVYLPTSTIAQSLAGFSGTHLNLLGVNPASPTAGVVEGDLFPDGGLIRYSNAVKLNESINENRLVELLDSKILGGRPSVVSLVSQDPLEILSYGGGPGSVLGIGKTKIKRTTNTTGINEYGNPEGGYKKLAQTKASNAKTSLDLSNLLGVSNDYFTYSEISNILIPDPNPEILGINPENGSQLKRFGPQDNNKTLSTLEDSGSLVKISKENSKVKVADAKTTFNQNNPSSSISTVTYGVASDNKTVTSKTAYVGPVSGSYSTINQKRTYNLNPNFKRNRYGNPGLGTGKKQYTYTGDKFNATNTDKLNTSTVNEKPDNDQLFKFYLNLVDPENPNNKEFLYWQAYVDNFSDQVGADYDSFTYTGRGYPSYRYKGFNRSINLDFTIVATSPDQMLPIYTKLNRLIQNLAPNYSSTGYIRGNFVKLTFGDYLVNVPGIINGFSINPIFEAGFDIGIRAADGTALTSTSDLLSALGDNNINQATVDQSKISSGYQLPKAIKISGFNFTPIASNDNRLVSSDSKFIGGEIDNPF